MLKTPLISCIMPTYNRRAFIPHAIRYFLRQQYENKELIIIDDGADKIHDLVPDLPCISYYQLPQKITLGAKLNLACNYAKGNIIVNWDDDDWYADWRLSYQVESLISTEKEVCGINTLLYFNLINKNAFQYVYPADQRVWLLGSSLCFKKELWSKNKFADINVGMDGLFVWKTPPEKIAVLANYNFSVHMIHQNNVSPKKTDNAWWHSSTTDTIKKLMGDDWQYYANGHIRYPEILPSLNESIQTHKKIKQVKNVFACLVHEQPDCIEDLIKNLHYNDPASTILLFNGSTNANLIPENLNLQKFNAIIYPTPAPIKHGYLHDFAFKCIQFALEELNADIITIVDSDQLCIHNGYSEFISSFFTNNSNTGLLSSNAQHVNKDDKTNHIALQAFREYDLWKPLLQQFANGEEHFVYWTFWPSTVFTKPAATDLVNLYHSNTVLQNILRRTKIWASEEVIFPTLVKLLGYEVENNPCSYELVKYKQAIELTDLKKAFSKPNVYWIHPVSRSKTDGLRKFIRNKFDDYNKKNEQVNFSEQPLIPEFETAPFIEKIKHIQGWLSEAEATLLLNSCLKALSNLPQSRFVIDIGSYYGRATILLGSAIKQFFPDVKIVSIDPHDGRQGARDQGLKKFSPSLNELKKNIAHAGLNDVVQIIQDRSYNVQWHQPVSFLFIDGLHDYESVSTDFNHFEKWLVKGGCVAFHDYADYFPGVKRFVDKLLITGCYQKITTVESIIIIQKLK